MVLQLLLALLVMGSVLAIGTVHVIPILVVGGVAAVATAFAIRLWPAQRWQEIVRSPIGLGLALAAFTFIQALPLPTFLLRYVAPTNADVWNRSLLAFGEAGPAWASISLDPGASIVETLKWLIYTGVFASAMVLARRRGRTWGVLLVFASGVVLALVTIGHGLAGAAKVYGWYTPHFSAAAWHIGPLLNTNNLAGYLNLAAMCGLGLLLSRQTSVPRWLIALGAAVLFAVVVIAASRGGLVTLLFGLLLLAVLVSLGQGSSGSTLPKRNAVLLLLAATAGGAVCAVLGSTRETWAELYDKNLLKVRMLGWARPMIADHFWLGTGRGAFESVFPAYRLYPGNIVFTHAENFPAQWMSEWGVPVALAAIAGFAWCIRPAATGFRRSILATGVSVGIAILLLQNLFDLGLEVTSLGIALSMAFGSIWGGWDRSEKLWKPPSGEHTVGRRYEWLALAGTALLIFLAAVPFQSVRDVAEDREELHGRFRSWVSARTPSGKVEIKQRVRDAMLRHPAEPYFPLLAAEIAWLGVPPENPLPALSRSLERSAQNGRAHLLLAEILLARGARSQARLELRLAVSDAPELAYDAGRLAMRAGATHDELLETVPNGPEGLAVLDTIYGFSNQEGRLPLLRELEKRDASNVGVYLHLADYYFAEMGKGDASSLCRGDERSSCEKEFDRAVKALDRLRPTLSLSAQYQARFLLSSSKPEEAEALLSLRCPQVEDAGNCQFLRASAAAAIKGKPEVMQAAIRDLQLAACGSAAECAATATTIGDMLAARGEWGTALTYFKRACTDEPNESRWLRLADAAAKVGAHRQAADALEKVASLRGKVDAALRSRIDAERNHALGIIVRE
jgi:tetratricopeptide (TPR) repeat protein